MCAPSSAAGHLTLFLGSGPTPKTKFPCMHVCGHLHAAMVAGLRGVNLRPVRFWSALVHADGWASGGVWAHLFGCASTHAPRGAYTEALNHSQVGQIAAAWFWPGFWCQALHLWPASQGVAYLCGPIYRHPSGRGYGMAHMGMFVHFGVVSSALLCLHEQSSSCLQSLQGCAGCPYATTTATGATRLCA